MLWLRLADAATGSSRFLREMPDPAIDTFVQFAESRTSPTSLAVLEQSHGAVSRVQPDATAFPTRSDPFDLVLISAWTNAGEDARHIEWTRQFHSAMEPWSAGSVYVNSLDQDDVERVADAYAKELHQAIRDQSDVRSR
jgi:hypothetical protein